jgi:hypothetical protein
VSLRVVCRGGGHKRRLRDVDFTRRREGVEGVVERLEYDPNRTGYIALVRYPGEPTLSFPFFPFPPPPFSLSRSQEGAHLEAWCMIFVLFCGLWTGVVVCTLSSGCAGLHVAQHQLLECDVLWVRVWWSGWVVTLTGHDT